MKIIISPAKSIEFQSLQAKLTPTKGQFLEEAQGLVKKLSKFSTKKIEKLMHVSKDIAELNHYRFNNWQLPIGRNDEVRMALESFTGEVYRGLSATTMNEKQLESAQNKLRILSGLYGLLKPSDLMYPYRLEMGTAWAVTPKTKNLYQFWGKKLAQSLNTEMVEGEVLINLASSEYFKALDMKVLTNRMITPIFKELKNDEYKIVMTYAKNARGKMTRYIIDHDIENPEDIKNFDVDSYRFHESLSSENEWVFTR